MRCAKIRLLTNRSCATTVSSTVVLRVFVGCVRVCLALSGSRCGALCPSPFDFWLFFSCACLRSRERCAVRAASERLKTLRVCLLCDLRVFVRARRCGKQQRGVGSRRAQRRETAHTHKKKAKEKKNDHAARSGHASSGQHSAQNVPKIGAYLQVLPNRRCWLSVARLARSAPCMPQHKISSASLFFFFFFF